MGTSSSSQSGNCESSSSKRERHAFSVAYVSHHIDTVNEFLENSPTAHLALTKFFDCEAVQLGLIQQEEFYQESFRSINAETLPYVRTDHDLPTSSSMKKWEFHSGNLLDIFTEAKLQMNMLMAVSLFPQFLQSYSCKEWLAKRSKNRDSYLLACIRLHGTIYPNRIKATEQSIQSALAFVDPLERTNFLQSKFLTAFLVAVENLPICFSIASASSSRRGFPLIYVNKVFEEITQYSRDEVIGKNCNFLQGIRKHNRGVTSISERLRAMKPARVELLNYRKNGDEFLNHLSTKPIRSHDGKYKYVIGIQVDKSYIHAYEPMLKFVDQFMKLIPDRLPCEESPSEEEFREILPSPPGTSCPTPHSPPTNMWKDRKYKQSSTSFPSTKIAIVELESMADLSTSTSSTCSELTAPPSP